MTRWCVWPDCLTDAEARKLCDDIHAESMGEETTPGPDKRVECKCTEPPPPRAPSVSIG